MLDPLTPTERRVYQYLLDFLAENTYQPSIREIGKRFKIRSTKTVSDLLQSIARKGYIEREGSRSRGVRIVGHGAPSAAQPVPYYGRVHAGEPMLLPEDLIRYITVDREFVPGEDAFFLKVTGNSMIGRGIHDGDMVLVHPATTPKDGDVIVARLGAEATLKTLRHRGSEVVLESANPADADITVAEGDDFGIIGPVCGIYRPMLPAVPASLPVS